MMIIGFDPGSRFTGFAVLVEQDRTLVAERCDVFRLDMYEDHADRIHKLFELSHNLIHSFKPDECAIETPVYGKDPMAMLKLGRAQAACMLASKTLDTPISEYMPKMVKKSITGNGNASKQQVAYMIRKMVKVQEKKLKMDATDALAVAWCHSMRSKQNDHGANSGFSGWKDFVTKNSERTRSF